MKLYEITYSVLEDGFEHTDYAPMTFYMFGYSRADVRRVVKETFDIMFDWAESNGYEIYLRIKILPKDING